MLQFRCAVLWEPCNNSILLLTLRREKRSLNSEELSFERRAVRAFLSACRLPADWSAKRGQWPSPGHCGKLLTDFCYLVTLVRDQLSKPACWAAKLKTLKTKLKCLKKFLLVCVAKTWDICFFIYFSHFKILHFYSEIIDYSNM